MELKITYFSYLFVEYIHIEKLNMCISKIFKKNKNIQTKH